MLRSIRTPRTTTTGKTHQGGQDLETVGVAWFANGADSQTSSRRTRKLKCNACRPFWESCLCTSLRSLVYGSDNVPRRQWSLLKTSLQCRGGPEGGIALKSLGVGSRVRPLPKVFEISRFIQFVVSFFFSLSLSLLVSSSLSVLHLFLFLTFFHYLVFSRFVPFYPSLHSCFLPLHLSFSFQTENLVTVVHSVSFFGRIVSALIKV